MAAKFFVGLPLDAPDPECVLGHGETALQSLSQPGHGVQIRRGPDHSRRRRIPVG